MIGLARARRGGLARPLLTVLGLLLLAGYVLVSDGSRLLAKEHDGEVGPRECVIHPTLICVGNVGISGLGTSLTAGSSYDFNVDFTNVVSTTTSDYTMKVTVPSSAPIGFNNNCSSKSKSKPFRPSLSTHTEPVKLYACRWSSNASITVRAILSHSGEAFSESTQAVTVSATNPGQVTGVSVSRSGERGIKVTWSKPTWDGGTNLTGYHVQHNEGTSGWPATADTVTPGSATTHTIQGIFPERTYKVRVRACNAASLCGAWSAERTSPPESTPTPTPTATATVTPESAPGLVTHLVVREGDGQLRLTWRKPANSGSAAITGYHVQNKRATETTWPQGASVIDHDEYPMIATERNLEFTVSPLVNGTEYDVRVQACNADSLCNDTWTEGSGTPTATPPPTTVTVPRQIRDVSVTLEGGSLEVDWSAPLDGGSAITRYEVQYREDGSDTWLSAPNVTNTKSTITGVTEGTDYRVRVRACNDEGCGVWSTSTSTPEQVTTATTPSLGTPAALGAHCTTVSAADPNSPVPTTLNSPTNLEIIPYPGRTAILVWDAVAGATGYIVEIRQLGETTWLSPNRLLTEVDSGDTNRPCYGINLDQIVTFATDTHRGLADVNAFEFRVKATHGTRPTFNVTSVASHRIIIIDTPISEADGDSRGGGGPGKAELTWKPMDQVVNSDFTGGKYRLRYRKAAGSYSSPQWKPGAYDTDQLSDPPVTANTETIERLTSGAVYAIQLLYEKDGQPPVFAARDVYVWPSYIAPPDGSRVATFPLTARLPSDQTYKYRICDETFEVEGDRKDAWITLIDHAFMHWSTATNGQVTTIREIYTASEVFGDPALDASLVGKSKPCADYAGLIERVKNSIGPTSMFSPPIPAAGLEAHARQLLSELKQSGAEFGNFDQEDDAYNEVLMFDDISGLFSILREVAFPNIAAEVGNAKKMLVPAETRCSHWDAGAQFWCPNVHRPGPNSK